MSGMVVYCVEGRSIEHGWGVSDDGGREEQGWQVPRVRLVFRFLWIGVEMVTDCPAGRE
jgi:hypothetical protein